MRAIKAKIKQAQQSYDSEVKSLEKKFEFDIQMAHKTFEVSKKNALESRISNLLERIL